MATARHIEVGSVPQSAASLSTAAGNSFCSASAAPRSLPTSEIGSVPQNVAPVHPRSRKLVLFRNAPHDGHHQRQACRPPYEASCLARPTDTGTHLGHTLRASVGVPHRCCSFLMTTAPPARRRGLGYAQPSPARRQGWTVPAGGGCWPGTWLSPYCSYFTSHRYVVYSPTKKGCRVG